MRSLSSDLLQDLFDQESGEAILALVTIEHADLNEPIRVTSDGVDTYRVDQDSTTVEDVTSNDNDGTINGAVWSSYGPNDDIRTNLSFDGTNDSVSFTDDGSISLANLTVECWFKPDSRQIYNQYDKAYRSILSKGKDFFPYSTDDLLDPSFDDDYQMVVNLDTDAGSFQALGGSLSLDQWHHAAMVYDGSSLKVYLDGDEVASEPVTGNVVNNTEDVLLAMLGTEEPFGGNITDVRIWNIVRSQSEIQNNKNNRLQGNESGLVAYWSMTDATLNKHLPFPFQYTLPDQSDEGEMNAKLVIDNVDRRVTKAVRTLSSAPKVTTEIVRGSDPDTIEAVFPDFNLTNVSYDQHMVEGTLTLESLVSQPYPAGTFNPSNFANLF